RPTFLKNRLEALRAAVPGLDGAHHLGDRLLGALSTRVRSPQQNARCQGKPREKVPDSSRRAHRPDDCHTSGSWKRPRVPILLTPQAMACVRELFPESQSQVSPSKASPLGAMGTPDLLAAR